LDSPAFGQADLTNCERELIHLAGSVQPHGVLLLLRDGTLEVMQASDNCQALLGLHPSDLLGQPLARLKGDLATQLAALLPSLCAEPLPLLCTLQTGATAQRMEATAHRAPGGGVALELEPLDDSPRTDAPPSLALDAATLQQRLAAAVQRYTSAATTAVVAAEV